MIKADVGSFVASVANPANITKHFTIPFNGNMADVIVDAHNACCIAQAEDH